MQLASKMRFISAQFERFLDEEIWLKNARHSNRMARLLEKEVRSIDQVQITQKVESNAVFAILPIEVIPELQKEYFFYVWNESTGEVRWMCSFDTTEEDVRGFASLLHKTLS
jgi:threonine aldolase